jgi:hypothetical protein
VDQVLQLLVRQGAEVREGVHGHVGFSDASGLGRGV